MAFLPHSVFAAQPLLLDIRQRRFLVGIRFAVETAQLSGKRLWYALECWHDKQNTPQGLPTNIEIFADAWAVIDNARRLQRLLLKAPMLSDATAAKEFVNRWPAVKSMRDVIQHPDKDFRKENLNGNYVYGTLFWVDARYRLSDNKIYAYTLHAGPQVNHKIESQAFPAPISIDSGDSVHSVVLTTADAVVNISDLLSDVERTIAILDEQFTAATNEAIELEKLRHPDRAAKLELKAQTDLWSRVEISPETPP
jgi:hypothetical protein